MTTHRFEAILGAVLLAVLLCYCYFVSAGPKLTREEVDSFVAQIDKNLQMPEPARTEFLTRVRAWGYADDGGATHLANVFHFNDPAEMATAMWPGLEITPEADGEKTHAVYLEAVRPLILPKGVWPAIGTRAQGVGISNKSNVAGFYPGFDEWSEININRYRDRRTIMELFSNPEYLRVMPYKLVGLRLLTVPVSLRFQLPDLRLALGSVLLMVFLAAGWIRAERRARTRRSSRSRLVWDSSDSRRQPAGS
jgi:hypothetical protein